METIQIILQLLSGIGICFILYFNSYSKEKGKNIATKEDIEDITHKIETVKNQIHYTTQSKLSLKDEERNAVVDVYDKLHSWTYGIMNISYVESEGNEEAFVRQLLNDINKLKFAYISSRAIATLFVRDEEFLKSLNNVCKKVSDLHDHSRNATNDFRKHIKKTSKYECYKDKVDNFIKFYLPYSKERKEMYDNIVPDMNKFTRTAHFHLQSLLEEQ